jgi:DNA-binding SARP family transcriptional activator
MPTLRIELLGEMRVRLDDESLPSFPSRKSKALFAFLLLHPRRLTRDVIVGNLWAEKPDRVARQSLRTELHRVRCVLAGTGRRGDFLVVRKDEVGFDWDADYCLDVEEFEARSADAETIEPPLMVEQVARLEEATKLYRGALLEGCFEEWALYQQERIRYLYLRDLELLMRHHVGRAEWHAALTHAQRLLRHDSLREDVQRVLMAIYYRMGNRAAAVRQFRSFATELRRELDIEPMRETVAQYQALLADIEPPDPPPSARSNPAVAGAGRPRSNSSLTALCDTARQVERLCASLRRDLENLDGAT